jgi:hypothetical protein
LTINLSTPVTKISYSLLSFSPPTNCSIEAVQPITRGYNTSESYKQAYVKTWNDVDDTIDESLLQEANVFLYEVLLKLGASSKIPQINMPKSSFEIASMLDIDKRAKKILLKSQSENDRLIVLKRILKKAIIKIDYEDPARSGYPSYAQFEA